MLDYNQILSEVVADTELNDSQKRFLLCYFGPPETFFKIRESCSHAGISQTASYYWRNEPEKYPAFARHWGMLIDLLKTSAEEGLMAKIQEGEWSAIRFALEKLDKKYGNTLDITTNGKPITQINFGVIKPEDYTDEGDQH